MAKEEAEACRDLVTTTKEAADARAARAAQAAKAAQQQARDARAAAKAADEEVLLFFSVKGANAQDVAYNHSQCEAQYLISARYATAADVDNVKS